jgi:hypothetical protein
MLLSLPQLSFALGSIRKESLPQMFMTVLSVASFVLGIAGLVFGFIQHRGRGRAESVLQVQLSAVLNRVRAMVPYRKDLEGMLSDGRGEALQKWVWSLYKGLSDLYVAAVSYYLSSQSRFTYAHLEKFVKAGGVNTRWEEKIWRDMLALRPENKDGDAPGFFIKDAETNKSNW